jgi:histidyl-tRNA synthetase
MRILDSKDPRDRPAADSAPDIDEFLTDEARGFFDQVTAGLDAAGVTWMRNARLVRGLDYYRHTAFEFVTDRLGAQGTVLAGGRYDGLIEALGGPHTPAIGWAAGIERLAMMIEAPAPDRPAVTVIPDKPELEGAALEAVTLLRRANIPAAIGFKGSAKKRSEVARKQGTESLLYIRQSGSDQPQLHMTHYNSGLRNFQQDEIETLVSEALGGRFGYKMSAEGWNRP